MTCRAIRVALLFSSLPLAGCGTIANLAPSPPGAGGKAPFGGVRLDVSCMKKAATGDCAFGTQPKSDSVRHPQAALLLLCAADLPLTVIGDVVTWPYAVSYTFINSPVPTPPVTQAPPAPPPPAAPAPAPAEAQPQTPPSELLPEPRKIP